MSIFMQKSIQLTQAIKLKRLNNERKEISAFNNLFLQTRCFHIKFSSNDEEDALFLSAELPLLPVPCSHEILNLAIVALILD